MTKTYIFLLGMLLIISMIVITPWIPNRYEFPRFVSMMFAGFAGILLAAIHSNKDKKISVHPLIAQPVIALLILYVLWNFITDVLGLDPKASLMGTNYRYQGFLMIFSGLLITMSLQYFTTVSRKLVTDILIYVLYICAAVIAFVGIYQLIAVRLFSLDEILFQDRIIATFGNPNFTAGFLAMLVPFVFYGLLQDQRIAFRLILLGILVSSIVTMIASESRSGILALLVVCIGYGISELKLHRKALWGAVMGALVLVSAIIWIAAGSRQSQWDNRIIIWQHGFQAFSERPIFGYGQENFALVFPDELMYSVDSAHNIFLEVAVASGVIGLFIFCILILTAWIHSVIPVRLALIAFVVTAMLNPVSVTQYMMFFVLLGLSGRKL